MDALLEVHRWAGYAVFLLVLWAAATAFRRGRNAQEFSPTPFVVTSVLLDIQVVLGIVLYGTEQYWEHPEPLIAYVHPAIMLLALVAAHLGVRSGRNEQMVQDAHRKVGRAMVGVLVLLAAGIGVASAV
ncbi:MAG: hypothetical protein R3343_09920 [Nitriliruptorales bacterium]|nr:hypothetical protein [Nitriliruptorales bacterium]